MNKIHQETFGTWVEIEFLGAKYQDFEQDFDRWGWYEINNHGTRTTFWGRLAMILKSGETVTIRVIVGKAPWYRRLWRRLTRVHPSSPKEFCKEQS